MQAIFTNRISTIKLTVLTPSCSGSVWVGISAEYTMSTGLVNLVTKVWLKAHSKQFTNTKRRNNINFETVHKCVPKLVWYQNKHKGMFEKCREFIS